MTTWNISCMPSNTAGKTYVRRMVYAMICYMVALIGTLLILRHFHAGNFVAVTLSILPSIPIVGTIAIVGMYLQEEKDEFQRAMMVQALLCATGGLLALSSMWGLAEMYAPIPTVPVFYVFPVFWFLVGVFTPLVRRRYGSRADE